MTQEVMAVESGTVRSYIFSLDDPPVGTNTVTYTIDTVGKKTIVGAMSLNGVNAVGANATRIGSPNPISTSVNVLTDGGMVVAVLGGELNTYDHQQGNERWDRDNGGLTGAGISLSVPNNGSKTVGWSNSGNKKVALTLLALEHGDAAYAFDFLDVYESSSTTLGSGTVVCTNVDLNNTNTCTGDLKASTTYRFEMRVNNTSAIIDGTPTSFEFRDAVGASDVLGSITNPDLGSAGCGTDTDWSATVVGNDVSVTSGTTCTISASGNEDFWFIVTPKIDLSGAAGTFFVSDGGITDTSTATTFTVLHELSLSETATTSDILTKSITKKLSDTSTISDEQVRVHIMFFTLNLSETATISDEQVGNSFLLFTLSLSETATTSDVLTKSITKKLSETATMSDVVAVSERFSVNKMI